MEARARMTPLTQVAGTFRAQVLAARLRSEGIASELRGAIGGAYGFTVGDMARVDVYVPEDALDDARYVLLADEVDAALAAPTEWWDAGVEQERPNRHWLWWVAAALLAVALSGPLVTMATHW
jgi:hypothetical protein